MVLITAGLFADCPQPEQLSLLLLFIDFGNKAVQYWGAMLCTLCIRIMLQYAAGLAAAQA